MDPIGSNFSFCFESFLGALASVRAGTCGELRGPPEEKTEGHRGSSNHAQEDGDGVSDCDYVPNATLGRHGCFQENLRKRSIEDP